ncbi:hypothetical protein F2Q68_00028421 [Brassica cretica]|uniref:Uncharacterized protein n=1 Tax=Brassica cretica TaxID=69181 RepID=A0A8S9II64_BRACR|nr:hypothetical protein F2Q68_00028421 [Brassica cretica]
MYVLSMHVQCSSASLLLHFIAISKHCITPYFAVFPLFYSVEYGGKDSCKSLSHPHELLRSTSGGDGNSPVSVCVSPGARCSTSSESPTSAANSPSAESTETPSQASNAIVTSNWLGLSGTSMFQGLIDRALRTVRGSADDIGWLQHDPEMPPAEDGTDRRKQFLKNHPLPQELATVSFLTEASISPAALATFSHVAQAELPLTKLPVVMPLGAAMAACAQLLQVRYGEKSDGLVTCCDAEVPGSVVVRPKRKLDHAWMVYSSLNEAPLEADAAQVCEALLTLLVQDKTCALRKGDIQALEDLTYERRKQFLKNHPLPQELATVSFLTEASISPAALATFSHVAQAELPLTKLPVVMPLGAAMAACAQLLQVRYGEKSDGLVTCCDAEVPGSVVVRPKRKLDHAWMVYSSLNEAPLEADAAQVCEALLTLLVQVEEEKQRQLD